MKYRSIPESLLIAVIGLTGLLAALQLGCTKTESSVDDRLKTQIESEEWKKCDEVSQKTDYDAYFIGKYFAERLILAGRVSAIAEELESSHARFLNTGDLIEIFPALYYYETQLSLEAGMKPKVVNKVAYMRLIIAVYDGYKRNRDAYDSGDKEAIDPRWSKYFQFAENSQPDGRGKWSPKGGVDVLAEGINAHLLSDVPRAISFVLSQSSVDKAELERDFEASDDFYVKAEGSLKSDVLKLFNSESGKEEVNRVFGSGTEFVAITRKKAWDTGVERGPFGSSDEQPTFEHDALSRKYFPKELIDRGICR